MLSKKLIKRDMGYHIIFLRANKHLYLTRTKEGGGFISVEGKQVGHSLPSSLS
jgi:hypothetical protein